MAKWQPLGFEANQNSGWSSTAEKWGPVAGAIQGLPAPYHQLGEYSPADQRILAILSRPDDEVEPRVRQDLRPFEQLPGNQKGKRAMRRYDHSKRHKKGS